MSSVDIDDTEFVEYVDKISEGVQSVIDTFNSEEDGGVIEKIDDLWGVLDEFDDVLGDIDLSKLPEAIEVSEIPDAVDIEETEDGATLDLSGIQDAVRLRELWDAVDLTEVVGDAEELQSALDEVLGEGDLLDDDDIEMPSIGSDPETRQAFAQDVIQTAAEEFREVLLASHEQFLRLYRENQDRFGQEGRQPDSRNPTAFSTMPPGPVADSASTRQSTVPRRVRHSSATYHPPRIYGRRFERAIEGDQDAPNDEDDQPGDTTDE